MKIGEIIESHTLDRKTYRLLPEKDIVEFMRAITECPFCGTKNLRKQESHGGLILTCKDCDFQITSSHLYHHSRVEEGMQTIRDVVSENIKEAVEGHEQELMKKLTFVTLKLDRIKKALGSHFAL
jgi:ribosomal protein L37AE/L43A